MCRRWGGEYVMKKLGKTNLLVSNMGLGCMSMSEFYGDPISNEQAIHLFKVALNNGVNFFDTADIYGYGRNELLIGKSLSALIADKIDRNKIIIATKCGIIRSESITKILFKFSNSFDLKDW